MGQEKGRLMSDESTSSNGSSDEGIAGGTWLSRLSLLADSWRLPILAVLFWVFGAAMFVYLEGHEWLEAFYLITQIITTVGYGDITFKGDWIRLFLCFYILLMLALVSYVMSDLLSCLIERNKELTRQNAERMEAFAASMEEQLQSQGNVKAVLDMVNSDFNVGGITVNEELKYATGLFAFFVVIGTVFFHWWEPCSCSYGVTEIAGCTPENMCHVGQRKTVVGSIYMSIITLTTVGFGDKVPLTRVGRIVGIPWMIIGVGATAYFLSVVQQRLIVKKQQVGVADSVNGISRSDFEAIDKDRSGTLSRYEFVTYMLLHEGGVDEAMINSFENIFNSLDFKKTNAVSWEEIKAFREKLRDVKR